MSQIRSALAILLILSVTAAAQTPRPPKPDAIIDTPEFMTLLLKPAYVEMQRAVEKSPTDRAEWAAAYQKAVRLAETANLLFIRRHAGAETPEWAERSAAARDASAAVADAVLLGLRNARPEGFEMVKRAFGQVSVACNACHRRFGGTNAPAVRDQGLGIRD
jgi:cytochrome c556